MELVSVIIPTHNRENLVGKAIDSVLAQTYKNVEIIVVDDASTDNTENMINKNYFNEINYVKVEKSKGGNHARNLGVQNAKGNYIAFLDDDDTWHSSKLEKQMNLFNNDSSIGLVYTGTKVIYTSTGHNYKNIPKIEGDLSDKIFIKNYIGTTSTVAMKKSIFEEAGGFDIKMPALQDYDLWIRVSQITKVAPVQEALINYYNHDTGSQISDNFGKIIDASAKIEKKYSKIISHLDDDIKIQRSIQKINNLGKRKMRAGNKKEARRYFLRSFKTKPHIISLSLYFASFLNHKTLVRLAGMLKNE